MKLISKFHDYYDGALAQGRDEQVLYVRQRGTAVDRLSPDTIPWLVEGRFGAAAGPALKSVVDTANAPKNVPAWMRNRVEDTPVSWRFEEAFVLLAGKPHAIWLRIEREEELLGEQAMFEGPLGAPDLNPFCRVMRDQVRANASYPKEPEVKIKVSRRLDEVERRYAQARERFLQGDYTDLHLRHGAPVLLLASPSTLLPASRRTRDSRTDESLRDNVRLIKNPRLADLHFASAMDPFACFQALSQFIGGVVPGQQMPMVEISDKSKIQKKGFDPTYGFRTRPSNA